MFKKLVFGRKSRPFTENVFNFLQHTNLLTTLKDELDCDKRNFACCQSKIWSETPRKLNSQTKYLQSSYPSGN